MIEVDVFWSFAIGSSLACMAAKYLQKEDVKNPFGNKYFAYIAILLSCLFAPSGIYLILKHPGWESMFVLNRDIVNNYPLLITLFAATNSALGIFGYYVTFVHIHNFKDLNEDSMRKQRVTANIYWTYGYVMFFAILCLGYDRFTFVGEYDEYHDEHRKLEPFIKWIGCDVFKSLFFMGIPFGPALFYPLFAWTKNKSMTEKNEIIIYIIKHWFLGAFMVCLSAVIYIHFRWNKTEQLYFLDERIEFAGIYAPIVAYLFGVVQICVFAMIPLIIISKMIKNDDSEKIKAT